MKSKVISLIIVNWNGKEHLEECLHSLSKQTIKDFEIILVDNGPNSYLIPRYSHVGAALSTLLSEIFMLLFYIVLFVKKNIFLRQNIATSGLTDQYQQGLSKYGD